MGCDAQGPHLEFFQMSPVCYLTRVVSTLSPASFGQLTEHLRGRYAGFCFPNQTVDGHRILGRRRGLLRCSAYRVDSNTSSRLVVARFDVDRAPDQRGGGWL